MAFSRSRTGGFFTKTVVPLAARFTPALFAALLFASLSGCGQVSGPSVRLALDGPPLLVAAKSDNRTMTGVMDRSCMAGVGDMRLFDRAADLACHGQIDRPATDKGRLYIDLACSDGTTLTFVMRNLGPDQGMGIGRMGETENLTMFYHPCAEEAARRLEQLHRDIDEMRGARAPAED
ncbi:MAG: hypothetical protein DELT_01194 [Desulfovibrio sp.]